MSEPEKTPRPMSATEQVNEVAVGILALTFLTLLASIFATFILSIIGQLGSLFLHNALGWVKPEAIVAMEREGSFRSFLESALVGLKYVLVVVGPPGLIYGFAMLIAWRVDHCKPPLEEDWSNERS